MSDRDDDRRADDVAVRLAASATSNTAAAATPTYTLDQISSWLTTGYWGGLNYWQDADHNLTVNLTGLTAAGQNLARLALGAWSDVANLRFTETTGAAQITFDDNQSGAFANWSGFGTAITSASINVSTSWLASYGTGMDSYSFQTYVHEIGHALGLGHGGDYNGDGTYGIDNHYANDTWSYSVMSYFSQSESGFGSNRYVMGAQLADIVAMHSLYGAATARTGDTIYGHNANAGTMYSFASYGTAPAFSIYDSGGTDTLDASGYAQNQTINLVAEGFSSLGGLTNNISVARGTIVENARGGAGADTITGNAADNTLTGNDGNDTLAGGNGRDTLIGGAGADVIWTGTSGALTDASTNLAYGGTGNDQLNGGAATDSLYGDEGADTLSGGAGIDYLVGGFDLSADRLDGGGDGDNLYGFGGTDTLNGDAGNDGLYGGDGNDTLAGGAGQDFILGEAGNDTIWGDVAGSITETTNNTLVGQAGNDIINGAAGTDSLYGDDGADTLNGNGGIDYLVGGYDLAADVLNGGAGGDNLYGFGGDDGLNGGADGDGLYGGDGIDSLHGDGGDDFIMGEAGNDNMYGDAGNDVLVGGEGNDIVFLGDNWGHDQIHGFEDGIDRINMQAVTGLTDFSQLTINNLSGSTQIVYGTNTLYVLGINPILLTAADFDL